METNGLRKHRSRRNQQQAALFGFLLGFGAPAGWLALRFFYSHSAILKPWLHSEVFQSPEIYIYLTVATVPAFTVFGWLLGRDSDDVSEQSAKIKGTLEKVNVIAMTDALTGLHNARYLHDHLLLEMESAERYETPMACLMIDIDDFKKINDTYGHPCGDAILSAVAKAIQNSVRRVDIIGRLGGEEFLVIMPHTSSETAFSIAERIRETVQRWPFTALENKISVTISIGVGFYPAPSILNKNSLLQAVDGALYEAKRSGKNKVVVSGKNVRRKNT